MNQFVLILPLGLAGVVAISTPAPPPTGEWATTRISRHFWAEGCCVADVNKDGHPDVLSGPYWHQGPDFTKSHEIHPPAASFTVRNAAGAEEKIPGFEGALGRKNAYSDNFISYAHDFNGDGWKDYLVIGFPGKETFWYENPTGKEAHWPRHTALRVTDNESPAFADINGDRIPDLLAMSEGTIGYASYDPAQPTAEWKWRAISPKDPENYQRFTHGLGHGDINGDGLTDILEKNGWWEQPASWDGVAPWKRHDVRFGTGGAQMYGYDVNGDGRTDVITSLSAHGYGLAWFEQNADSTWKSHLITGTPQQEGETGVVFTQPHAIELADLNGDGLKDIVTGKRFWAHGPDMDPEPAATPVLYAFELKRDGGNATYTARLINDQSGVGTQVISADLNRDGKPDIVTANKLGCFVHLRK